MDKNPRKRPRDENNLTLSEIDRMYDSDPDDPAIECFSSGGDDDSSSDFEVAAAVDSDDQDGLLSVSTQSSPHITIQDDAPSTVPRRDPNRPQLTWSDEAVMKTFLFTGQPGLLVPVPGDNNPIDYFNLLVDDTFLQSVISETNANAEEVFLNSAHGENSRINNWKDLNLTEFKTFLGLFLHTGIVKMPQIQHYWRTDKLFKTCFGDYMSRDRFLLILRCLHFAKNDSDSTDRLHKIRPIIDHFNSKMLSVYEPKKELSLDESMVLWRGRLVFRQYIKQKRHKYGIKLYLLTEPNGLVLKFCVFAGALDQLSGVGHTEKVVMHLLSERLRKGHAVFADNFYNSVPLSKKLLSEKTYITGTLRSNRVDNPKEVMSAKLKKGESCAKYHEGVMVGKWKDSREVTYISNQYENEMISVNNRRGEEKLKPLPVSRYNDNMSGIDRQDQLLSYYPSERKTIRWYKKLFVHILQMSLLNCYLLYNQYHIGKKLSFLEFRLNIIKCLLTPLRPEEPPVAPLCSKHLPTKHKMGNKGRPLRRTCVVCKRNNIRKDTTYMCEACDGKPALCLEDCFQKYHE